MIEREKQPDPPKKMQTPQSHRKHEKETKSGESEQETLNRCARSSHRHPTSLSSGQELVLPDRHPALFLFAVVATAAVRTLGARLADVARPLAAAGKLCQAEVAVHQALLRLEDAAGEEKFHAQRVSDTRASGDQAAGGLQDVRELLGADGGRSRWVQAADVGEADLAVAGPGNVVVGEERRAHRRDGDGDVAHAREAGEEVADVLAVAEVAGVGVVEAVAGAGRVLEDFEGEARGLDKVEEASDGDGADVGQVQAFEVGGGLGDHCKIFVGYGLV